ncbi:MAG: YceI family protein [Methylotenera sp.]|uniref:YceI family protein n=1 Tax=Methylotenera sp. TaxID=2051956 RepID=UPI0024891764|nr:YceI family protein [Methylotenera sp.]MDI1310082.1 YceI family protein [Methylotenera sp.]
MIKKLITKLTMTQILAILIGSLVISSLAQAVEYTSIQQDKSSLGFVYKQMGVPIDGSFKKFTTQLSFDPAKLAAAKATLDIDLASIDAGSDEANDEVAGKEWFNAKAFPHAKFESSSFKSLGANRYEVTGKMTIKGRSQTVSAPFTFNPQASGTQSLVDGAFVLKRADFAIGEGSWADFGTVANEIQIKFHFLAKAK